MAQVNDWFKIRKNLLDQKIKFFEQLIDERKGIHEKQTHELLEEECSLGTRFLQLESRQFSFPQDISIAGSIFSALARLAEQRRQSQLTLWKDVTQLQQQLQEVFEEKLKLEQVPDGS